jgi:hypothetical protein
MIMKRIQIASKFIEPYPPSIWDLPDSEILRFSSPFDPVAKQFLSDKTGNARVNTKTLCDRYRVISIAKLSIHAR